MPELSEDLSTDQMATLRAAVASDHHSKAAYIGRVSQTETVTIIAEDGTSFEKEVTFTLSWESISKILDIIRKRSGI